MDNRDPNKEIYIKRADAHILLANEQMNEEVTAGEVSSSFMYGLTRFNAWVAARSYKSAEDLEAEKEKAIDYFVTEYKKMLEQHINEHIKKFDFDS